MDHETKFIGSKGPLARVKVASDCDVAVTANAFFEYGCGESAIVNNNVVSIAAFDLSRVREQNHDDRLFEMDRLPSSKGGAGSTQTRSSG